MVYASAHLDTAAIAPRPHVHISSSGSASEGHFSLHASAAVLAVGHPYLGRPLRASALSAVGRSTCQPGPKLDHAILTSGLATIAPFGAAGDRRLMGGSLVIREFAFATVWAEWGVLFVSEQG